MASSTWKRVALALRDLEAETARRNRPLALERLKSRVLFAADVSDGAELALSGASGPGQVNFGPAVAGDEIDAVGAAERGATEASPDWRADVNRDRRLTPLDALLVANRVNRSGPLSDLPAADVNGDGYVDAGDFATVVEALPQRPSTIDSIHAQRRSGLTTGAFESGGRFSAVESFHPVQALATSVDDLECNAATIEAIQAMIEELESQLIELQFQLDMNPDTADSYLLEMIANTETSIMDLQNQIEGLSAECEADDGGGGTSGSRSLEPDDGTNGSGATDGSSATNGTSSTGSTSGTSSTDGTSSTNHSSNTGNSSSTGNSSGTSGTAGSMNTDSTSGSSHTDGTTFTGFTSPSSGTTYSGHTTGSDGTGFTDSTGSTDTGHTDGTGSTDGTSYTSYTTGTGETSPTSSTATTGPTSPTHGTLNELEPPGDTYGPLACGNTVPEPWREPTRKTPPGPLSAYFTLDDQDVSDPSAVPLIRGPIYVHSVGEYPEDGVGDDSFLAAITIINYKQYYMYEPTAGGFNDNPNPTKVDDWQFTRTDTIESGTIGTIETTETISAEVSVTATKKLGGKFSRLSSETVTFTERNDTSTVTGRTVNKETAACASTQIFNLFLVTEVEYYWSFMEDTYGTDGYLHGFTEHSGFATATSRLFLGPGGEVVAANSVMRPVYRDGILYEYEVVTPGISFASPHLDE